MDSENSNNSSDAHFPRLNFMDMIDLPQKDSPVALSDLNIYYTRNNK